MDFPSLNVMVCFCDSSLGPQNSNNFIKNNNALQKQTSERDDPYSSDVIDSYFVEGYQLKNLNYNF